MDTTDCQPDFCLDLFEPSGHGRKRKRAIDYDSSTFDNDSLKSEYTKFKENIEYTVILPGEYDENRLQEQDQCKSFILISGLLAALLALSTIIVSI